MIKNNNYDSTKKLRSSTVLVPGTCVKLPIPQVLDLYRVAQNVLLINTEFNNHFKVQVIPRSKTNQIAERKISFYIMW